MTSQAIAALVESQHRYFATGATLPVERRITALKTLYAALERREQELYEALKADLGKSDFESFLCEVGLVKTEISDQLRHIRRRAAEHRVPTPLAQFASRS